MGGLVGGALTAYLLGPEYVNTGPHACKKTFIDSPLWDGLPERV